MCLIVRQQDACGGLHQMIKGNEGTHNLFTDCLLSSIFDKRSGDLKSSC